MNEKKVELVVDEQTKPTPIEEGVYLEFLARFQEQVKPDLDKFREARRLSEEEANRHFVY